MRVASFDIGKKTFSFYVEDFDENIISSLIPPNKRYNQDGTPTSDFNEILDQIFINGNCVTATTHDLTENCLENLYLEPMMFHNMTRVLDDYSDIWSTCDLFLIEQQMAFRKKYNTMAVKLGQHCWSYFAIKYGITREIIEIPAYYKTQVLGADKTPSVTKSGKTIWKNLDARARKKWTSNLSENIMEMRHDKVGTRLLKKTKKIDDRADCICQLQAFKVLRYLDNSI